MFMYAYFLYSMNNDMKVDLVMKIHIFVTKSHSEFSNDNIQLRNAKLRLCRAV